MESGPLLCVATVKSNKLVNGGCIEISVAGIGETFLAWVATPMAGSDRGVLFLPEVGDQVLVAMVAGADVKWAVLGSLWSSNEMPTETNADGENDEKVIRTRGGNVVKLVDTKNAERIEIATVRKGAAGDTINKISIDTSNDAVVIDAAGSITLTAKSITIHAKDGDLVLQGGPNVKIN